MITFDLHSFEGGLTSKSGSRCTYRETTCSRALSPSKLPGLDWALNPYKGCEHGCAYCYVPSMMHIDRREWGRFVYTRKSILPRLGKELKSAEGTIGVGTITDPYQPLESRAKTTLRCLELISRSRCRASIHTKSDLVLRDLELLRGMGGAEVGLTVTTLDERMAASLEPNAPSPKRRLEAMHGLVDAGIETYALVAPLVPLICDLDLEAMLMDVRSTGVERVMFDRLRARPGIIENLTSLSIFEGSIDPDEFRSLAMSPRYFERVEAEIIRLCEKHGMKWERAF